MSGKHVYLDIMGDYTSNPEYAWKMMPSYEREGWNRLARFLEFAEERIRVARGGTLPERQAQAA
ncbi:MAG: hypothetical protein AB7E47_16805 [Desulfovibrionaceae bacterium]